MVNGRCVFCQTNYVRSNDLDVATRQRLQLAQQTRASERTRAQIEAQKQAEEARVGQLMDLHQRTGFLTRDEQQEYTARLRSVRALRLQIEQLDAQLQQLYAQDDVALDVQRAAETQERKLAEMHELKAASDKWQERERKQQARQAQQAQQAQPVQQQVQQVHPVQRLAQHVPQPVVHQTRPWSGLLGLPTAPVVVAQHPPRAVVTHHAPAYSPPVTVHNGNVWAAVPVGTPVGMAVPTTGLPMVGPYAAALGLQMQR